MDNQLKCQAASDIRTLNKICRATVLEQMDSCIDENREVSFSPPINQPREESVKTSP